MVTGSGEAASFGGPTTLAGLLRTLRERALLTQEQLAERAGLNPRTIRWLESGRIHRPRGETVRLLADALGLGGSGRAELAAAARPELTAPALAVVPALDDGAATVPTPAEAPTTGPVAPAQLPADLAEFTGRADALDRLDSLLPDRHPDRPGAVGITVITGAAGVGKTALAVHWAHRAAGQFPDGQLHVALHGYAPGPPTSPMQALAQLLQGLGMPADRIPVEVEAAAAMYRSLLAGRRMLIVLDNARDAEQVRPLVPGAGGSLVVVTSRDRLIGLVASHGAHWLPLDVLAKGEAIGLLARILGEQRVDAEPQSAAELASACGLLPLALRIAAANLTYQPDQPIADYVAELQAGDRLSSLEVDGDPQAAMRTAFGYSYQALPADAQRVFRLLALVPGPDFTAGAVAALADLAVPPARRVLARLAAAHLVEPRGPDRWGFHDLLRRYAHQQTDREDPEPVQSAASARLLQWYLHTADNADRLLYPHKLRLPTSAPVPGLPVMRFEEHAEALAWLEAERLNLVAGVRRAATIGPWSVGWQLADALRGYFWENRHAVDWLAAATAGLDAATSAGDVQAQAAGERSLGLAWQCLGEHSAAAKHYASALALAREAGWVEGEGAVLGDLAYVSSELGRLQQAADYLTQNLALHRQSGYKVGLANALGNLGHVIREMGRLEEAARCLHEAVALHREIGTLGGLSAALNTLGEVNRDLGRLDEAQRHLTEALAHSRELGNRYSEAYDLHILARVHSDAGRGRQALESARAAVALARETGEPRLEADTRNTLGAVLLRLDRPDHAIDEHRQALDLARRSSARYPETEALLGLAAVQHRQGHDVSTVEYAEKALATARQGGYRILAGQAHLVLAAAHMAEGRRDEAVGHAQEALAIRRASGCRLDPGDHLRDLELLVNGSAPT